ncbi:MAG TPA: nucleoside hydrolase [Pseudomonadales bacterium]
MLAGLAVGGLAAPVDAWRTGRPSVPALPLVPGGPPAALAPRLWIDSDAACGAGRRTDSDDCLAVLALLAARDDDVVGVSSTAGNAPLAITHRTLALLLREWSATGTAPPLYRGTEAGSAGTAPAVRALRQALAEGPLTVVALGPLTNVAGALEGHPALAANLTRLVAVFGHRRGHLFHPSEASGRGNLFGHGPVFTDFNVRADPAAVRAVLSLGRPVTLVGYDAGRSVAISAADLNRLVLAGGAAAWVADRARDWLAFWNDAVGMPAFHPFDLVAAGWVLHPDRFRCARTPTWVAPTRGPLRLLSPLSVVVGVPAERPPRVAVSTEAVYCADADARLHDVLMERLVLGGAKPSAAALGE